MARSQTGAASDEQRRRLAGEIIAAAVHILQSTPGPAFRPKLTLPLQHETRPRLNADSPTRDWAGHCQEFCMSRGD